MMKKSIVSIAVVSSMLMLASCSSTRPDNSDLIKDKYAGVDSSQALEMSSQIYGSDNMSSDQVEQMKKELMDINCRSVYFGFDSYNITDDAKECLDKTADYLIAHPDQPIKLSGNTDPRGSEKYNFNLGQKRAEAVYNYLLGKNVNKDQICVVSYGKLKPAAEPTQFYDEFCTDGVNDTCSYKASEKAFYLDRRTEIDFGVKCDESNSSN
ncbi:OmpA family protein [Francisella philomiragia]|uniref:OmpA family protein n=2 Tax=Francisella philomiragia TaxID=28110 RepID=A0AAW3DC21_9GAMM|nr:OmpA family protein [Francisella philomiragia]AJI46718.1 outer membrane P6 domain protein [Francisella philomiragia]AJI49230.1 outer membrane P6 domain protein [Francisella philomiragia]AJI55616.1 outer membrane P6 domain protein [Francisella philomiragia]KFJ43320.1 outer membrane P6 domain protein [Francisella philomiragia]MBK2021022.1 OmpA family protein [Francisella philomiragia]